MKTSHFAVALLSVAVLFSGCGKKADPNKPIEAVQQEAQAMSAGDLQKSAEAYAEAISEKKEDLEKETEKLKGLTPQEMLGDKGREFKDSMSKIGSEVQELTKRYEIYAQQFAAKGGDMSKIKVE